MIWKGYCSKEVQVAIEEISDFASRIENDPLELLKEVETLMHVPQRAKYPPLTLVEVLSEFLNVKQGDKESLLDYLNRFKSEVVVVKQLFGTSITDYNAENKDEYKGAPDDDTRKKVKKDSWNEFISVLFLRNSNHQRFSSMMLEFRKGYANNDDRYPKSLLSMMDVMRQQPEIKKPRPTLPTISDGDKNKNQGDGATSFAQTDTDKKKWRCHCCGDEKCRLSTCTKKATLPKEKWHRPEYYVEPQSNAESIAQTTEGSQSQDYRSQLRTSTVAFGGMQVHTIMDETEDQEQETPDMMIDSGSTLTLGKDRELFEEIHNLNRKIKMNTNGGSKNINQEGTWRGYGHAYYLKDAMTNIVSLSDAIEKGFLVFFDSDLDNAFYVTDSEKRTVRFPCNEQGLYVNEQGRTFMSKAKECCCYQVVNMNNAIEGFTPRQVVRAVRAKKLYHDLHAETVDKLKAWIRSNVARNVPVSTEDVNEMKRIFGKDRATLKGKRTKPHPPVVDKLDIIELLPELNVRGMKVELAIDVVYINDQSFLHAIDRTIKLRGIAHLGTRKKGENYTKEMLFSGIDVILRHYNKFDIWISLIHADNEFRSILRELEDIWDTSINFSMPGEHVPDIERINRVLQEHFRVALY